MAKTLRVEEDTYEMVMNLVGQVQLQKKHRVSVDAALKAALSKNTKKDPHAWDKLEKLMLSLPRGPKTNCVEEIDLIR